MRIHVPILAALAGLAVLTSAPALAQGGAALAGAREALTHYDLSAGSAPLRALGDLAPIATGTSADAAEARAMRALAGAELWAAATMLGDDVARVRVAAALGVTDADAVAHLRTELGAAARGAYRTACREANELLDVAGALLVVAGALRGEAAVLTRATGPRRDAAFALYARSHLDLGSLAAIGPDVSDAAIAGWDESNRHAVGALREAIAAAARARRAATSGDPLLALVAADLATVPASIVTVELRPRLDVPAAIGLPSIEGGAAVPFDVLVLVAEREVHIGRSPVFRLDASGALVEIVSGEVLPAMRTVAIAADLPPVPQVLEAVALAASALALPPGAVVLLAPTGAVPAHVMTRVLMSLARASVTVTHLAAERADETIAAVPFRAVRTAEAGTPDVHARVRLGGYAVARGTRGRDTTLPRVRDAGGALAFDAAGLRAFLESGAHATVALEAMATVSGADVVRTAFLVVDSGAAVTWLLP